ncbi:MAG TPA: DUF86 domain-containing protein [Steroidobacteraceae bacterium]|nr:DUF86 domain-containing protein [Steroidobacteraceae bacterium]
MPDYLSHILDAIARIEEYTGDLDEVGFLNNKLVQDGVIRNIEVIGEACNHIRRQDPGFVATHTQVPWGFAVGMRNVLSHGYFKVDLEAVWKTVQGDLPELARQVKELRDELVAGA